jgi:hypothetical protein
LRILLKLGICLLFLFGYMSSRPIVWLFINIIFLQAGSRTSEFIISSTRITTWGLKFSTAIWSTTVVIPTASSFICPIGLILFWFLTGRVVVGLELLLYLAETYFNTNCRSQVNIYSLIYNYRLKKCKFIFRYSLACTKNLIPYTTV